MNEWINPASIGRRQRQPRQGHPHRRTPCGSSCLHSWPLLLLLSSSLSFLCLPSPVWGNVARGPRRPPFRCTYRSSRGVPPLQAFAGIPPCFVVAVAVAAGRLVVPVVEGEMPVLRTGKNILRQKGKSRCNSPTETASCCCCCSSSSETPPRTRHQFRGLMPMGTNHHYFPTAWTSPWIEIFLRDDRGGSVGREVEEKDSSRTNTNKTNKSVVVSRVGSGRDVPLVVLCFGSPLFSQSNRLWCWIPLGMSSSYWRCGFVDWFLLGF